MVKLTLLWALLYLDIPVRSGIQTAQFCHILLHPYLYIHISPSQVNHLPGSFQIGRKDRLWRNLYKMQVHFGKRDYGFFPQTYCLPFDLKLLKRAWEDGGTKQKWILKPVSGARERAYSSLPSEPK